MKIIIAGAGEVGYHLAKLLSYESQDITLIDCNKDNLAYADSHLDIRVIKGDATSVNVLKDARVASADLVITVTSSETTNITICVLAKQLGCRRTIARISNTEFIDNQEELRFKDLGIDELISPEKLAARQYAWNQREHPPASTPASPPTTPPPTREEGGHVAKTTRHIPGMGVVVFFMITKLANAEYR